MVRVTIDREALKREFRANDFSRQARIMRTLKDAGVPVLGVFGVEGVATGRLAMETDQVFGDLVFEYYPDER